MRIVIVEDESEEANIAKECLTRIVAEHYPSEKSSLLVDVFSSAEEFLDKFKANIYDLILLDICLGETNGMQAAKKVREIDGEVRACW